MGRIYRSPWEDFPDVVVQTTVARMQAQPGYGAAKRGDPAAAFEVLRPLLKPDKVPWEFDAVIPVIQFDRDHQNALPGAYASLLAPHCGVAMLTTVKQDNVVSHTGADAPTRILAQPTFKGKVEPGLRVVIVDDVVSFGATLANLRGWLERQEAVVVGATTLAAHLTAAPS
jgi:predicted amidophosphoribosyltransferase